MDVYGTAVASYMASPVTVYQHHLVKPTSDPTILIFYNGIYLWTTADGEVMKGTYAGYLKMNANTGLFESMEYSSSAEVPESSNMPPAEEWPLGHNLQ